MNNKNMNDIISDIKKLKHEGIQISNNLDPEKIMCEFELLKQKKNHNKFTLSSEYRLIKFIYNSMLESLAVVDEKHIKLFIPLARSIEKIKSALSDEYEIKKRTDNRIMQLKKLMLFDSAINDGGIEDSVEDS